MPIPFLHLHENEQVVLVLHRHWFVLAREFVAIAAMFLLGIFVFFFQDSFLIKGTISILHPLASFLFSLYVLIILALSFAIWINYRLDVWLVTTRRIIDVEQRGLFNREVSEFLISNVQDITTEVPTMIMTLLDFGNMTIQTAGEKNFVVHDVPKLEEAKRIILEYCHKAQEKMSHTS